MVQDTENLGRTLTIFPRRDLHEEMRSPVLGNRMRYSGLLRVGITDKIERMAEIE